MVTMRTSLTFHAPGLPKAQPRPRAFARGKHAGVYDPGTAEHWKFTVREAAKDRWDGQPWLGAVRVDLTFVFPRPRSHFRTGKNAQLLRDDAPRRWHTTKPDRDNLEKAVLDALSTLGIWEDDCQVCSGTVRKVWANAASETGCAVMITEAAE